MKRLIFKKQLLTTRKKKRNNTKMDAKKVISKEGLKWKCREHPDFPCEFICLDADVK